MLFLGRTNVLLRRGIYGIVNAHYDDYSYYPQKAFEMYCQYTDRVEPFGMDECWLDLTDICDAGDIKQTADEIRSRIKNELGLTCSAATTHGRGV